MKTTSLKLVGTLGVLAVWLGCSGRAKVPGEKPPSPILELETHHWGSFEGFSAKIVTEVRAKPGDFIGKIWHGEPAFTVVEIPDKDHVKVRVADSLLSTSDRYRGANEVILRSGQRLAADTGTMDGGISYTLRISDLDEVPVVKADDPKLIAAISAHANVTKDEVGSIQEVGPPGICGPGKWGLRPRDFDPSNGPNDADLKNIAKLNNLRHLFLAGSAVTDAGLPCLFGLKRLKVLDISRTEVSAEGAKAVQKALPNCKVVWSSSEAKPARAQRH